jgi:predicted transcriptional regulator of viral defense system
MIRNLNLDKIPEVVILDRYSRMLDGIVTMRSLRYFVGKMVTEGSMLRLKSNVYAKRAANPFYVASVAYGGYIGFSSALYLLGLKEEVEETVFVCVNSSRKRLNFLNRSFVPVNVSRMFYGTAMVEGVLCASFPKVVFDMFYRPRHASFFDLYRALNRRPLSREEWRLVLEYVKSSNIATARRLGYALEGRAPEWFTGALKKLSTAKGKASSFMKPGGRFINRWKLYDDIDIKRWENAR